MDYKIFLSKRLIILILPNGLKNKKTPFFSGRFFMKQCFLN